MRMYWTLISHPCSIGLPSRGQEITVDATILSPSTTAVVQLYSPCGIELNTTTPPSTYGIVTDEILRLSFAMVTLISKCSMLSQLNSSTTVTFKITMLIEDSSGVTTCLDVAKAGTKTTIVN